MTNKLKKLNAHMQSYRITMDGIFSAPPYESRLCMKYFFELLRDLSQVYADSIALLDELLSPDVHGVRAGGKFIRGDVKRFAALREDFETQLKSLPCWASFEPRCAFSEVTGLFRVDDYLNSFSAHLPEIYEATLCVRDYADSLLLEPTDIAIAGITTGLEHMSYHHICFVLPPLQRAGSETAWRDYPLRPNEN